VALLEVRDLRVVFDTEGGVVHAVDGVSFSIEKGRTLGLVGESGCGKSVTASAILRLVPSPPGRIVGGQVIWKGRDLVQLPVRQMPDIRGKEIAMIFQDPMTSLNPVLTVRRQMEEVLALRQGLRGKAALPRLVEMMQMVGIADPVARLEAYPHELSGGMKQRVMIAMALLSEPDLLIADEPTTALDVTVQAQILHLMKELQQRLGTAILLITHNMGVVAETCDEVVVMYAGRAVETAPTGELFTHSQHPYTRGLLDSIPRPGVTKDRTLATIEGVVPSLITPPAGCRFADRCFQVQPNCRVDDPRLAVAAKTPTAASPYAAPHTGAHSGAHTVACHYPLSARS